MSKYDVDKRGSRAVEVLETAWQMLREIEPKLPPAVLTFVDIRSRAYLRGYFAESAWKKRDGAAHEIAISPSLIGNPGQLLATMLHEAAHALLYEAGENGGAGSTRYYHTKKFRDQCRALGLACLSGGIQKRLTTGNRLAHNRARFQSRQRSIAMSEDNPQVPVSKFQRVQAFFTAHPEASLADAVAALKQEGLDISPRYVSQIKSKSKSNATASPARKRRRRKKPVAAPRTDAAVPIVATAAEPATTMSQVSAEAVVLAIQFMRSVGGSEGAKAALSAAEQVEKALRQPQ